MKARHQIRDHSDPDLSEHRIGSSAEELLDLEILFDTFKEQLDPPTSLVDVGDRFCREFKMVVFKDLTINRKGDLDYFFNLITGH